MPQRISKYEIRGELGQGGFGKVYLGFDPDMARSVAIKVLTSAEPSLVARFRNEAMAAGNLHHKNLVTIHEFGEDQGVFFLIMEYLEGRDLQKVLREPASLTLADKLRILSQTAEGLHCAHQNGIVHRDVKPSNIMVLNDGTVKVMDFGIARLTRDNSTRLTQSGYLIGTLAYMAPEQLRDMEADALCDIWAYGMIFYELLTGEQPVNARHAATAIYAILEWQPQNVSGIVPGCPPALDPVLHKLLAKNRNDRYQSMEDVLFDLAPVLRELDSKQAEEFVTKAESLIHDDKLDQAQQLIRRVLARDPSNARAREMHKELQVAVTRRSTRIRVDDLRVRAEEYAANQDFVRAIQAIESAIYIDPENPALKARFAMLHALNERKEGARRLVEQARRDAELDRLTAAFHDVNEALKFEPANEEARSLLTEIQRRLTEREAQQNLTEGLAKARGLLALQSFKEAEQLLEGLASQHPDSLEVRELKERARQHREAYDRQRFVRSEIDDAKEAIKRGEFTGAIEKLELLRPDAPAAEEVAGLIAYGKQELAARERTMAVNELWSEAWSLLQAKNFSQAEAKVQSALSKFPESESLLSLRDMIRADRVQEERRAAIQRALQESAARERAGDLGNADAILQGALRDYPDEPDLKAARDRLAAAREQQAREQQAREQKAREQQAFAAAFEQELNQTGSMLDRGQLFEATRLLKRLEKNNSSDPRVISLQQRVAAQQEQEARQHAAEAAPTEPTESTTPPASRLRDRIMMAGIAASIGVALLLVWLISRPGGVDLQIDPSVIQFDVIAGGQPVSKELKLTVTGAGSWSATPSQPWLSVQPGDGNASQEVLIIVDPHQLPAGTYPANVAFSGGRRDVKASVALTVRPVPIHSEPPPASEAQSTPERKVVSEATKRTTPRPAEAHVNSSSTRATVPLVPTSPPVGPTSPPVVAAAPPVVAPSPAPEVLDCHSPSYANGLRRGELTWTGALQPREDLVIVDSKTPLRGQHLPGCEVSVSSMTNGVRVTEQPQRSDGFRRVAIHNDSDAVLPDVRLRWQIK